MAQALLGGLLPAIFSGADQLKRGVYGLLTNPQEQAERAAQSLLQSRAERQALMAKTFANPERPFQVTDQAGLSQLGTDVLTGELGIAPVGMFIGQGSKLWKPEMAFKAAKMEKAGKSPQEIWKETGTVKAPDGQWRQEISDAGSEINKLPLQDSWENFSRKAEIAKYGSRGADVGKMSNKEFKEFQKFRDDLQQEFNSLTKREAPLSDVLVHKELYEAYPDIAKLNTMQDKSMGLEGELNPFGIKYGDVSNKNNLRGLFLHEGQHGIQINEGWALGGSPKNYTQQAEAELAKKALLMRSEIDAMPSSIPFDERAKTVKELFEKLDQTPIDKKTMDLVKDYTDNPSSQLQEIANFYGLDRRSSAMSPDDVYKRLFGEAEARLTQSRMDLTPEQRLDYFPYNQGQYGLDVPLNEVIVRGLLDK